MNKNESFLLKFEYLLCGCARLMFQNKQITDNQTLLQTLALIYFNFLGAFSKLRKATIRFIMSVRPHGTTRPPLDGFS